MRTPASRRSLFLLLAALTFGAAACGDNKQPAPAQPAQPNPPAAGAQAPADTSPATAVIETDAGTIRVELLPQEAPRTVENFKALSEQGFYNGLIFHRVISGFMIQGGDPNGNGTGGRTANGQPLPNEIRRNSPLYQGMYRRGLVAMANKGIPETGTSQFFIMHQDYRLPPNYTIFGRVTQGMEVVDRIATAPRGANDRPINPVKIRKITIEKG